MNRFITFCVVATMFLATAGATAPAVGTSAAAQQPDSLAQQISERRDSLPVATLVPVQKQPYASSDTISRDTSCNGATTRAARRACRAEAFAFGIDSLVATQSFAFYPTTMQSAPQGMIRMIYAGYFYVYISPVDLEVHLPVERGVTQYVTMLNFDADTISGYAASKHLTQWNISFSAAYAGQTYDFDLVISTVTGETVLSVQGGPTAMRYVGTIGQRQQEKDAIPERRRRRADAVTSSIPTPAPPAHTVRTLNPATEPRPASLTTVSSRQAAR